jgi:hypothetical protein
MPYRRKQPIGISLESLDSQLQNSSLGTEQRSQQPRIVNKKLSEFMLDQLNLNINAYISAFLTFTV